jgi:ABC-type phosphate/phosphonate transport system substrate-binding protein
MKPRLVAGFILASVVVFSIKPALAGDVKQPILIGMPETMVVDAADAVDILKDKLATLMKEFTGLEGKLEIEKGAFDLARMLEDKKLHLGVFQGIEFAWVQKKHPKLKPFMVAISDAKDAKDKRYLRALLVVRDDAPVKGFADLKGKVLSFPKKSKDHVRVFLQKNIGDATAATFFKATVRSASAEAALDELLNGKLDGVVADKSTVDFYRFLKPGAFRKLRVVQTSEDFPVGVVAYLEGGDLDAKTLDRIEKGMLKANKSERGQDLMGSWGIAAFEPVFSDFQRDLDAILKAYPNPDGKSK